MNIRFAVESDLKRVNALRRQVNELHVKGKPEIFKPGFPKELEDHVYTVFRDPEQRIAVAERDGALCGFAVLHHIVRPETPFMKVRDCLDIDEFCVDAAFRRQGVGTALIAFVRAYAKERGFSRIELNMWEFNRDALAFYEAVGFKTYRRYLELPVSENGEER
ncbi:MAG: GNAT family N-acetyltransferase [Clostridia bacterium]|nr:GNAT family N-acetyltransferase [Clostridia bacterium]